MKIVLNSIGEIRNSRSNIEDDYWGDIISEIIIDKTKFEEDSLYGLEEFTHIEIVFYMDKVDSEKITARARHPRNRKDWPKVGIFSQRAKARPNQIGVSRCKIVKVEGLKIIVEALDAINGTPVLDIKPYMEEFGPIGSVNQPEWSREVMRNYYKSSKETLASNEK